jgi:hypothetical protein
MYKYNLKYDPLFERFDFEIQFLSPRTSFQSKEQHVIFKNLQLSDLDKTSLLFKS